MRSDGVVQHDDGTPTGSRSTSFFIRGILGPDAWSIFMRWLRRRAERFSVAASLVGRPGDGWRFRPGCSIGRPARPGVDPYLVISDGRMFWMQDAYTSSSYFPYAQPAQDLDLNYIRNSVKVVVDAYNGTVDFYLIDPTDPIAATYQRIFPSLFKPFTAMSADLQKHIRYPEDLFLIQARLYQTYHMEVAEVFYNREDLWQFPP